MSALPPHARFVGQLKQNYGDNLAILAWAVESPEDKIRSVVNSLVPICIGHNRCCDGAALRDITSVPPLFVFDHSGKTAGVLYGGPPDLHEQAGKMLDALIH